MSDLLNGPVIDGPRYHYQTYPPGTAAHPTAEMDGTPGSVIPTEWLDECREYQHRSKTRVRFDTATKFFAALITGKADVIGSGNATKLRAWCWDNADAFLADCDRPPHSAATAATALVPDVVHQRWYLTWLRDRDGSCLTSEQPPGMPPHTAADVRRHLHKRGLIAATHAGGAVEATGWAMTAAGWNSVGVPSEGAGGVILSEQHEAA